MNKPGSGKICIVGPAHPLRGGLAAYNERLARAYQELNNKVKIITFSLQYPGFLFPGKTQYSSEPPPCDLDIAVKLNSINPVNWIRVGGMIRQMRPDILIIKYWLPFMSPCLGTVARIAKKNGVTRVISILDNIIPHESRPGDRAFSKYFVKPIDGFIAMSRQVMSDLDQFNTSKPRLFCPHPLYDHFGDLSPKHAALENLNLDPSYKYILFFGFIRDYKGLDLLLQAMTDERIRAMKLKLLVAGEFYTDSKPYFDIIEHEKLSDRVIMSNDFIPDSRVADYFNASDIVVQPYKDATQSGVTQIAYHFEKPMITTDVGGLAEIVPDGKVGYVIKPDANEVSKSIIRFYQEEKEGQFIENIKIEKLKYSWDRMIESIDALLEEGRRK